MSMTTVRRVCTEIVEISHARSKSSLQLSLPVAHSLIRASFIKLYTHMFFYTLSQRGGGRSVLSSTGYIRRDFTSQEAIVLLEIVIIAR